MTHFTDMELIASEHDLVEGVRYKALFRKGTGSSETILPVFLTAANITGARRIARELGVRFSYGTFIAVELVEEGEE
jgi:hypothetical protein